MFLELSQVWIAILNTVYFPIVMLSVARWTTSLPVEFFKPTSWLYRTRFFEKNLWIFERFFKIKSWKHRLPDGSKMFASGFAKKKLQRTESEYINRFIVETCRGEFAHWIDLLLLPLVLLWNPPWAIYIMVGLGLIGNIPCILVQRYNRIRLARIKV